MKYLLDTHTLIWFAQNDTDLSKKAKKEIENPGNNIFLSIASFWEMAIKISLKKLELKHSLEEFISRVNKMNFIILPITLENTILLSQLPFHHKDPFDRLLLVQARSGNLEIISKDVAFDLYGIKRFW